MENLTIINLSGKSDAECRKIRGLVLDLKAYEKNLKYFNAEDAVNLFINSEFYSPVLDYAIMKNRCIEYLIDVYPNF